MEQNKKGIEGKVEFEESAIANSYQKEIDKLVVSKDTSSNIKNAKVFIQDIIQKEELVENDVLRLIEKVNEHFDFRDESAQEIIDFSINAFQIKENKNNEKRYKEEILKNAKNKKIEKIFPAIDYRKNTGMIYAVKGYDDLGNEQTYIATASKKIYGIAQAKIFGIIPKHEEEIDTRFSLSNYEEYDKKGKSVKANALFLDVKKLFEKFVVVSNEFLNVIVTYILMTYIYIIFQVIPYLWLNGEKGTGKSTIMKLMNKLCFNSLYGSNFNSANIYRQIDNDGSTIILDEFEKMYGDEKQEIIKLLNQGFNIDAIVTRCEGPNNKVVKHRAFSPKIMGGITNIDDVLFERCIKYTTERVKNANITKYRETDEIKERLNKLVDDLYIFGFIYAPKIKEIYDKAEINFKGHSLREDDLWNPLLCIAKVIDEENNNTEVTDNLLKYAKKLSDEKFERNLENEPKLQLLYYLYEYLDLTINKLVTLNDNREGVDSDDLIDFLQKRAELKWIKDKATLGKKIKQWYNFDKKRETGKKSGQELTNNKVTYYIFNKDDILKTMEDLNITLEDFK